MINLLNEIEKCNNKIFKLFAHFLIYFFMDKTDERELFGIVYLFID